jgi:hypothetical protein
MAHLIRRIERLERANRRWQRIHAVLLIGLALGLIASIDRLEVTEAQSIDRRDGASSIANLQAEARINLAIRALKSINQRMNGGAGMMNRDIVIGIWSRRLLSAQIDRNDRKVPQIDLFEAHLSRMTELEDRANVQYRERRISDLDQMEVAFSRLEAEYWLTRARTQRLPGVFW